METYAHEFKRIEAQERAEKMLVQFRKSLSAIDLSPILAERSLQVERICREFDLLALNLFPVELGHFTIEGQKTISSKYKDAAFEQKRTLRSMLAVLVLAPASAKEITVSEDSPFYQLYTHTQEVKPGKNKNKLSIESFNEMRRSMFMACPNKEELLTLETILSLHDITKLKTVAEKVESLSGVQSINHDLLLSFMTQNPRLMNEFAPSLNRLSKEQRDLAIQVMNLQYNRGQHAQAEASAAHLIFTSPDYADDRVVRLQRQENNADLSGLDGTLGGLYFNEMFNHYKIADLSIDFMRSGDLNIKGAYIFSLQCRARMMGVNIELEESDFENIEGLEKITLLRLACQYQMSTNAEFSLLSQCFNELHPNNRAALVETFGRSGLDGKVGILYYYSPALMCEIRDMEIKEDEFTGARFGIERGLRLMAKIAKESLIYFENPEIEASPLYTLLRTGKVVMLEDVIEIRGMNRDKTGRVVEYVIALTQIVKDNSRRLIAKEVGTGEANFTLIDN